MATVKLVKKGGMRASRPLAKGQKVGDFALQDNQDDTFTVLGIDAAGNAVDISAVATLTPPPSSSDPSILTVDSPSAMVFAGHTTGKLGHVEITATATWNDGSIGPFSFTLPVDVIPGPVTGVTIQPGTPTVH